LLKYIEDNIHKAVDLDNLGEESRDIYRHSLFQEIKKKGLLRMKFKNIEVLDYWNNAHNNRTYFKILHKEEMYVVSMDTNRFHNDLEKDYFVIDETFPNVDPDITVEKIEKAKDF
jgi:hypothetical protein